MSVNKLNQGYTDIILIDLLRTYIVLQHFFEAEKLSNVCQCTDKKPPRPYS